MRPRRPAGESGTAHLYLSMRRTSDRLLRRKGDDKLRTAAISAIGGPHLTVILLHDGLDNVQAQSAAHFGRNVGTKKVGQNLRGDPFSFIANHDPRIAVARARGNVNR